MAVDRRPSAATAGLVGLAVVAIGLAYLALTSTTSDPPATVATPSRTAMPSGSSSPSASLTASATPTAGGTPSASSTASTVRSGPTERPLTVVSAGVAWRATGGDCSTGDSSKVEVSTDDGATWEPTGAPGVQVSAIAASDARAVVIAGYDASCRRAVRTSNDGGATWTSADGAGGMWSADGTTAVSPAGRTSRPCGQDMVVTVEGAATRTAYALCTDGSVRHTVDGGRTWVTQSTVPGAAALAVSADGSVFVAVAESSDCAGLRIDASGDEAVSWNVVHCVAEATDSGVGLDVAGTSAMLVSAGRTFVSPDSAVTWTPAQS